MSAQIRELAAIDPVLSASRDELEALQLERLKSTLHHAYTNNVNYTRKFDAAGVHPNDLRSLADLARFPFTTKADLRDAYPFRLLLGSWRTNRQGSRFFRHHRQAHRGRLYAQ